MIRQMLSLTVIAGFAIASLPGNAHDIWITSIGAGQNAALVLNYGHPDDRPPPALDKVLDFDVITDTGSSSLKDKFSPAVVDGVFVLEASASLDTPSLIATRYDNGLWVQIADGTYRNSSRLMYRDAKKAMWSTKFAKRLTAKGAPWNKTLGQDLEIIPLSDPLSLAPGKNLQVKVLFHGKPLPDADVERGDGITKMAEKDIPKYRTDASGTAIVPLVKSGPHVLAVDYDVVPATSTKLVDVDMYNATLSFDLPADSHTH